MHTFLRSILLVAVVATPLAAQRGATPPPRDSTRQTPQGAVLDYQNQNVGVVLQAIAEAGGLNISMTMIPTNVNVTLRVRAQMTRAEAIETLKAVAEDAKLTVIEGETIIRIAGTPPPAPVSPLTAAQQAQLMQLQQQRVLNIYPVRLKHATATTLAPVLLNLVRGVGFAGTGRAGGIQTLPGGVQLQPGRGGQQQQQQQQGRGGRGGQDAIQALGGIVVAPPAQQGGGRGGNNVQQQLAQALLGQAFGFQQQASTASLAFMDTNIQAEESTNSLLIRATAEDYAALQQLIQSVDVRPLQVLIEVTIVQVTRTRELNVGISGSATRAAGRDTTSLDLPAVLDPRDFIALLRGGNGSVSYNVALNALQARGDTRVLSLPLIIAQNNRQAVLNVGSSVPFVSISQTVPNDPTGRVETLQYLEVGTTLTITPTINTDRYVNLVVQQTADNATENVQFNAPILSRRQAQTAVFVRDGQTTVIGGLADNNASNNSAGIPLLSRIPFIGSWLFGSRQQNNEANELYLFLTPHVVSSDEDLDRLRESIRGGSELLHGVPVQGRVNPGGDTIFIGGARDTISRVRPPVRPDTTRPPVRPPPPDTLQLRSPSAANPLRNPRH